MILEVHSCLVALHVSIVISYPLWLGSVNLLVHLFDIKRNMREAGDTSRVKELFKQQNCKSTPVYLTPKYSTFSSVLQLPPFKVFSRLFPSPTHSARICVFVWRFGVCF